MGKRNQESIIKNIDHKLSTQPFYTRLLKLSFLFLFLTSVKSGFSQTHNDVSTFLEDFLTQVEEGGVVIDEKYLEENTNMPPSMRSALRDSLSGNSTFILTKDKSTAFLSDMSKTLKRYGIEKTDNGFKLRDNRLINFEVKGPDLSAIFGGENANKGATDTTTANFPVHDINSDLYQPRPASNLDLQNPSNNEQKVEYDTETGNYILSNKVGDEELNMPVELNSDDYKDYALQNSLDEYWANNSFTEDESSGSLLDLGLDFSSSSKLFGKGAVDIQPQGYAELTFSIKTTETDNPTLTEDRRKNTYFDLDNKIQMNVSGSIGEKMNLDMNYNTEATFDFDNQFKLDFKGEEDDIMKSFQAGNVSMPSVGSLITVGGTSQSSLLLPGYQELWGFQNTQQYGKLTWSWVVSQQETETQTQTIEGGATTQDFDISVDNYDANRHFFLTHFFKENYDDWMSYLPNVDVSGLNVNKIEVWVTNTNGDFTQSRNVVGFIDLAETDEIDNPIWTSTGGYPENAGNTLYNTMATELSDIREISNVSTTLGGKGLVSGEDYEKVENARLLTSSEYTLNTTLGYISLRTALNTDEVLAVAFQYTYKGQVYQVGEFSSGSGVTSPNTLYLKLLKGTNQSPTLGMWDLMMKNIYALNAYNLSDEDFRFSVVYQNDKLGTETPYISAGDIKGKTLLKVMGLDTLNSSNEKGGDGFFDWIEGYTIQTSTGRVIFPSREPFGSHLQEAIGSDAIADDYIFQELYDTTLVAAQQMAEKNKFSLQGTYSSASGSEIKLNAMNIPRGSVTVTAGGTQLVENIDYTVDYNSGYLKILNEGVLESGQTIQVSMEDQTMFSMQKKTLVGTNLVYRFNDDLQIGASITHLSESSQTTKVAVGSDPISNTIWGFTGAWHTELPFLTRAVDWLPFTDTKAESSMTVRGEIAQLIAGHSSDIGESGTVYIDDFESTTIGISIQSSYAWDLASLPDNSLFPEYYVDKDSDPDNDLEYGYNRAKLAWYSVDRIMQEDRGSETPSHLNDDDRSNHYIRTVNATELFPQADQDYGESSYVTTLNLAYYPDEKGPYNYDLDLDETGHLKNPEERWGGITRQLETTNFESTNIEYIEFWMMDPFIDQDVSDPDLGGQFYVNLGNISEDVLRDGRKAFENGLPTTNVIENVDTTIWGRVSTEQSIIAAFDNNDLSRQYQDVGMDGLANDDEKTFFSEYISSLADLKNGSNDLYIDSLINDPSQDDYHYFRGSDFDDVELSILDRYKAYNNYEGNSPSSTSSDESYSTAGSSLPDGEDINQDFTLSESDSYYEYGFNINPRDTAIGENYIVDTRIEEASLENGTTASVKWYQYRIPVHEYESTVGSISDFTSIRFMRMYMTGFQKPVVLRMANLELVRSEWRRYGLEIEPDIFDEMYGDLDIEAVNYEENGERSPVNYILPPGVTRETDPSQPSLTQLNEQSMVMRVRNLAGRDSRAAYKVMQMDFRQYEQLNMWVHAEQLTSSSDDLTELEDGDLALFVRLGSDYNDNYYEYELPLELTPFGDYNEDLETDRYIVWPDANELEIPLELFTELKLSRTSNSGDLTEEYTQIVADKPDQKVSIKGSPSLSNVCMMMIGVRNTRSKSTDYRSAEIWVNELSLTGLAEDGGWAGTGSMNVKIADIGSANISGAFSTAGFGSIEQTLMERQLSDNTSFDVSTSLALGKLLPRQAKIELPMYYAYSQTTSKPKYDPLDQDLLLSDKLDAAETEAEYDAILEQSQTFESRRSLNFTNVRVNISGKKKRFYDPVNLSLSYAYSETFISSETVESSYERERNFGFNYNFAPSSKPIEPFKDVEMFKSDYLALIRDFNFYVKPQRLSFSSNLDRSYYDEQLRDLSEEQDANIDLQVKKDMFWDNTFSLSYKLAKSLSVDYNNKRYAIIDEIDVVDPLTNEIVRLNAKQKDEAYELWWDSTMINLADFGRVMDYSQNFNVRYTLPFSKIPMLDFISSEASYSSTYGWERGTEGYDYQNDDGTTTYIDNGNNIYNSKSETLNTTLKINTLYNKSKYLKDVSRKYGRLGGQSRKQYKTVKFDQTGINAKKGEVISINHKLGSKKASVKLADANGKTVYGRKDTEDENTVLFVPNADVVDGKVAVSARVEDVDNLKQKIIGYTVNTLMGLKTVQVNMSRSGSTTLPGFKEDNNLFTSNTAPGWGFSLGQQNSNVVNDYYKNGWLVTDESLTDPYMFSEGSQISARATIEPLAGLSIKLTSAYTSQDRISAYYQDGYGNFAPTTNLTNSGSYSHTWIALGTLREVQDDEYYTSAAFNKFRTNREEIVTRKNALLTEAERLSGAEIDPNSSEVLIPAFIAAYGGDDVTGVSLDMKPSWRSMMPNWDVTYSGLAKMSLLKDHVKSLTLRHNYTCTYSVGNFSTLTDYQPGSTTVNTDGDLIFQSEYDISSVTVSEGLNPLIGLDLGLKNNISFNFEVNQLRNLALNISSNQLVETRNDGIVIGGGYKIEDLQLFVRTGRDKKGKTVSNDLQFTLDFSIADVTSVIRQIDDNDVQPSSGNKVTAFKIQTAYKMSKNLDITVYYDKQITAPVVSTSYRTANSNFGMSFRFSLTQ